jgi:hypothetical protein
MAKYRITGPDGTYEITAPDDASEADILAYAQRNAGMVKPQEAAPQVKDRSMGEQAIRLAERGARGFSDSALETMGALPDLVSKGMRAAGLNTPADGFYTDKLKEGWATAGRAISTPLNNAIQSSGMDIGDLSKSENTAEKFSHGAGRGLADMASFYLPAAAASRMAPAGSLTQEAASALASQPVMQAASGLLGGGVGESTDSPLLGLAAGMSVPLAVGGAQKLMEGNPLKLSAFDRAQAKNQVSIDQAREASRQAKSEGVDLSFGQSTNLPSALINERQLRREPSVMNHMSEYYRNQQNQVKQMLARFTDKLSPVQAVDEGVNAMRSGAFNAVKKIDADRAAAASPLYKKALDENAGRFWIPELDPIMKRPSVEKGLGYAKLIAAEEGRDITVPVFENGKMAGRDVVPDWRSWDYIKRGIDRVIEENTDNFGKMTAYGRSVVQTKKELLGILDKANPDYSVARKAFETASPEVTAIKQGVVGKLAQKDGVERIGEIRSLFNANLSNPGSVGRAREAYVAAGRVDDWNAGVATYLKDSMDAASKSGEGLSAKRLVSSVFGDPRQKALIEKAMTPEQYGGFKKLMEIVENVARKLPEGSPTATDIHGAGALRGAFSAPIDLAKSALNFKIGDALLTKGSLKLSDIGMERLAKSVTSPDSVELLKKLRMTHTDSDLAAVTAARILGIGGPDPQHR